MREHNCRNVWGPHSWFVPAWFWILLNEEVSQSMSLQVFLLECLSHLQRKDQIMSVLLRLDWSDSSERETYSIWTHTFSWNTYTHTKFRDNFLVFTMCWSGVLCVSCVHDLAFQNFLFVNFIFWSSFFPGYEAAFSSRDWNNWRQVFFCEILKWQCT